jgi:hypothetical protein
VAELVRIAGDGAVGAASWGGNHTRRCPPVVLLKGVVSIETGATSGELLVDLNTRAYQSVSGRYRNVVVEGVRAA